LLRYRKLSPFALLGMGALVFATANLLVLPA